MVSPPEAGWDFASYFATDFRHDHVITEYWNGERWVFVDSQLDPDRDWGFDTSDMPLRLGSGASETPHFATAAQVWMAFRRGEIDADRYGADPALPFRGDWFIRNYVLHELAHRRRDELLLWDGWGAMGGDPLEDHSGDHTGNHSCELGLVDEVAALLLAADDGDRAAEQELADRYAGDERLHPCGQVHCMSPAGQNCIVDLCARKPATVF